MAAFTDTDWRKIFARLDANPGNYGLPERRDGSVVLASFNIRKLGTVGKRSAGAWRLLARFCGQCDLAAIQEVQDDLAALNHLKDLLNQASGGKYGLAASDVTGADMPRASGMKERLAFLFRWDRAERTEVASDITVDRSAVVTTLFEGRADFAKAFDSYAAGLAKAAKAYDKKLAAYDAAITQWEAAGRPGKKPAKPSRQDPPLVLPRFVTFIRTPHCVSFRVAGAPGAAPYEFLAVNAHLLYGDANRQAEERRLEFFALIDWLAARARNVKTLYHKNLMLFGDLNLDFDQPVSDLAEIEGHLKGLNMGELAGTGVKVNFPFLDVHPSRDHLPEAQKILRSNARQEQTYDQIALFIHDRRLPGHPANARAGATPDGFDYGVFSFVDLFAEALHAKPFGTLTRAQQNALIAKFQYDVSDHMPIWIRLPLPA